MPGQAAGKASKAPGHERQSSRGLGAHLYVGVLLLEELADPADGATGAHPGDENVDLCKAKENVHTVGRRLGGRAASGGVLFRSAPGRAQRRAQRQRRRRRSGRRPAPPHLALRGTPDLGAGGRVVDARVGSVLELQNITECFNCPSYSQ